jgi:hypothetical protein
MASPPLDLFSRQMLVPGFGPAAQRVLARLDAGEDVDTRAFFADLPDFFRAVAERGGLMAYGKELLAGSLAPTYAVDRPARPLNSVEKIIARQTWTGATGEFGVADVQPGDQVLCRAGFRGVHEYTAGMVMSLYQEGFGDAPMTEPDLIAAFERGEWVAEKTGFWNIGTTAKTIDTPTGPRVLMPGKLLMWPVSVADAD